MDLSLFGGEPSDDGEQHPDTHDHIYSDHVFSQAAYHVEPAGHAETGTSAEDHLWMHDDGRVWDLGPADVDSDSDGLKDSLTRNGPDGLTVYTDTDHDGQVDKITSVRPDGAFSTRTLDTATGAWLPTDSGRIG